MSVLTLGDPLTGEPISFDMNEHRLELRGYGVLYVWHRTKPSEPVLAYLGFEPRQRYISALVNVGRFIAEYPELVAPANVAYGHNDGV